LSSEITSSPVYLFIKHFFESSVCSLFNDYIAFGGFFKIAKQVGAQTEQNSMLHCSDPIEHI
jgi:hypothetical protein